MIDIDVLKDLPKLISWDIEYPYVEDDHLIVPTTYRVHGYGNGSGYRKKTIDIEIELDKIASEAKSYSTDNVFANINDLKRLAEKCDDIKFKLLVFLNNVRKQSTSRYSPDEIESAFLSGEGLVLLKNHCFFRTLICLLSRDKVFHEPDIQSILS